MESGTLCWEGTRSLDGREAGARGLVYEGFQLALASTRVRVALENPGFGIISLSTQA